MLKLFSYQIKMSSTFWKSMVMLLAGQILDFHVSVFLVSKFDKSYSNTHSSHCSARFQFRIQRRIQQLRTEVLNHRKVGQKGPLEVMQSNFSLKADGYQQQISQP